MQNLEALAKQSKIVYSVMGNSSIAAYFQNMAHAENALFRWLALRRAAPMCVAFASFPLTPTLRLDDTKLLHEHDCTAPQGEGRGKRNLALGKEG